MFIGIDVFHRAPYGPPSRSIGPQGFQMLLEGGGGAGRGVPVFLRKHIATYEFPGGGLYPLFPPLDPSMYRTIIRLMNLCKMMPTQEGDV